MRYTHETKDSFFRQPYNNVTVTSIFGPQNSPDGLGVITADQTAGTPISSPLPRAVVLQGSTRFCSASDPPRNEHEKPGPT